MTTSTRDADTPAAHTAKTEANPAADAGRNQCLQLRGRLAASRVVLAAALAVAVLAGGLMLFGAYRLTSDESAQNHALTDREATEEVSGEVGDALAKVFSYTPDGVRATELDARRLLRGEAATQYRRLYGQLRKRVTEQKLTLTTRVVHTGVVSLDDHRARLLVFLDQTSTRDGDQPSTAAAQLAVTAERRGGEWRIVRLAAR
ncbi:nuclear transport factor 2 family protein [Streptomyces sulphureus]|uniref:nuclear transport factor 2 family protein n=1 Tax=Streptomyces sulphureus TaxID=47758 RepID=UPI000366BCC2|nr:nuclear transport factor 2 family protein [Streptomyces sulphureus]